MKYLTIRGKLAIAVALLVFANIVALGMLTADRNEEIDVARRERTGAAYLGSLRELQQRISERRRLKIAGAPGDAVAAKEVEIDLALGRLEQVDLRVGPSLQSTEDFVKLKKLWQQITRSDAGAAAELDAKLDPIFRSMVALVGDTSALTLDSVIDTYYLTQVAVVRLSNTIERLDAILAATRTLKNGEALTEDARDHLLVTRALLEIEFEGVESDLRVVTAFNPALQAGLEAPEQEFVRSVRDVLAALDRGDQGAQGNRSAAAASAVNDALAQALTRNFKLHEVVIGMLDKLMETRIDAIRASRASAIASIGTITLIGIVAAFWVSHAASTRLRMVADAVQQTAVGRRHGPITSPSDDEVGALVDAVNHLVESHVSGALRHVVDGAGAVGDVDETLAEENLRLKVLVADLSLENQALRSRSVSEA